MRYCALPNRQLKTISDMGEVIWRMLCWPGDTLIGWIAEHDHAREFFEISQQSCGTWKSLFISVVIVLFSLSFIQAIFATIHRAIGHKFD